jgi:hypothetical protein
MTCENQARAARKKETRETSGEICQVKLNLHFNEAIRRVFRMFSAGH